METKTLKILVACHKDDVHIRRYKNYLPIQVGKELNPNLNLGFVCDNTGENISAKNGSYCELTALYWGWKNLRNIDYIGLCHYRRYFDISDDKLEQILGETDIIVPEIKWLPHSVATEISLWTSLEDVYLLMNIIKKKYPKMYNDAVKFYFYNNRFTPCNMFLSRFDIIDEYCKILFDILESIEEYNKIYPYSRQRRNLGYLAESFLGFYIKAKGLKTYRIPMVDLSKTSSNLKKKINNLRNRMAFAISSPIMKRNLPRNPQVIGGLISDGLDISLDYE